MWSTSGKHWANIGPASCQHRADVTCYQGMSSCPAVWLSSLYVYGVTNYLFNFKLYCLRNGMDQLSKLTLMGWIVIEYHCLLELVNKDRNRSAHQNHPNWLALQYKCRNCTGIWQKKTGNSLNHSFAVIFQPTWTIQ